MLGFFKNREGYITIGDYEVLPSEIEYTDLDIPLNSYGKLSAEQVLRYNEKPNDLRYIFEAYVPEVFPPTLEELKSEKLSTLQSNYDTKIRLGYTYNGWDFNLDENTKLNISDWTSFLVLYPDLNEFKITDSDLFQRTMTQEEFKTFGVGFGVTLSTLKGNYSNKRNLITLAESEEDLNNINIDL